MLYHTSRDLISRVPNNMADMVIERQLWLMDALFPILVLLVYTVIVLWTKNSLSMTRWQVWCFVCLLAKQDTKFKWKDVIFVFSVLQDSAETR